MRIDFYTKCVLTVIALCLVWLSLGGPTILPAALAQPLPGGERVLLAGWVDEAGYIHKFGANRRGMPVSVMTGAR